MNVLFTNVADSGEDYMIFVEDKTVTPEMFAIFYSGFRGVSFTEYYEVKDEELQFYSYSPVWISAEGAKVVKKYYNKVRS